MGLRHQRILMMRPSDAWILSCVLRRPSAASAPVAAQRLCHRPSSLKELHYFRENVCILYVRGKRVFHLVLPGKKRANLLINISSLCIYCIPEKCSSNQSESNSSLITIKAKPVYGKLEKSQLLRLQQPPQTSWVVLQKQTSATAPMFVIHYVKMLILPFEWSPWK